MRGTRSSITALASLGLAIGLLTGCSAASAPDAASSSSEQVMEEVVKLQGGWAKAAENMTGLFGTLENHGEHDLVITGVETDVAELVELHEVTDEGVMQEIAGDVTLPAGGSLELMPGGNHIMLMEMPDRLLAGDEVTVTVHFDDGTSADFTVLVKDYSGANEEYQGEHGEHGEHDHDAHESH